MTLDELAAGLEASVGVGPEERAALADFLDAAAPCRDFAEIERRLPAKARCVGAGPWLDAIRALTAPEPTGKSGAHTLHYPYPEDTT